MSVGQFIKEKRLDVGMLQKELAQACDVSVQTINTIERGKSTPSITTLRRIAQVIGVDYFQLRILLKGGDLHNGKDNQSSTQ